MSLAKVTLHNRVLSIAPTVLTRARKNLAEQKIPASEEAVIHRKKVRKDKKTLLRAISAGAISDEKSKSF